VDRIKDQSNRIKFAPRCNKDEVLKRFQRCFGIRNVDREMISKSMVDFLEPTIRGHVFCSFLAILLRRELERCLECFGYDNLEWYEMLQDIASVEEVTAEISDKKIIFRSELKGCAGKVFQAAGVIVPPSVRFLG
jgi:hypothetical protein